MFRHNRKWLVLEALTIAAGSGFAQDFPSRPVEIVAPQTPGGASDALARIMSHKLCEKCGQSVVLENCPGADGNACMEVVESSPADGYSLLMSYVGMHAINAVLYKKLPFNPEKDFAPVTLATSPFVMVTKADSSVKAMSDVVAPAIKSQPTYGSACNKSANHLVGEKFNSLEGVKLTHVPHRSATPAMQDLMGGHINLVFTSPPSTSGVVKNGTLHPVAVTSLKRAVSFSSVPIIAGTGHKHFDINPWFGLFAPAKVPFSIIQMINADLNDVMKSKDVTDKFATQGAEPYLTTRREFATVLKADIAKCGRVVKPSGSSVD